MENSLNFPPKLKNRTTTWSAIPLLAIHLKEKKSLSWKNICICKFIAVLFTIAKIQKQNKCPSMDKWINKMWYIQIMEHYTVIKEGNCVIFNNIDGSRQYYAKWDKLDRQRWILYNLTYMWNLKKTHVSANIIVVFALLKFVIWYWNMFSIDVMLYVTLMHIYHFMFFAHYLLILH